MYLLPSSFFPLSPIMARATPSAKIYGRIAKFLECIIIYKTTVISELIESKMEQTDKAYIEIIFQNFFSYNMNPGKNFQPF